MTINRFFNILFGGVFFLAGLAFIITILYVSFTGQVEYDPESEGEIHPVLGASIGILFGLVFMFIGFLQLSTTAKIWWQRTFPMPVFLPSIFLLAGLIILMMVFVVDEPDGGEDVLIQTQFGAQIAFFLFSLPFLAIGYFGLRRHYKRKEKKAYLLANGRKVVLTEFTVEIDQFTSGTEMKTGKFLQAYRIKAAVPISGKNEVLTYSSDPIWYDPTPFLKGSVTVLVNPQDVTEYYIDLSSLPPSRDVEIRRFSL